jgi:allophanate hydrolase subunit 1
MESGMKEKLERLAEEVQKNMANPDVDIDVCFDEAFGVPYLTVRYVVEGHSVHEKRIDIDKEYWEKDLKDLANFVAFQIEQFMEEIDSVEYGGE